MTKARTRPRTITKTSTINRGTMTIILRDGLFCLFVCLVRWEVLLVVLGDLAGGSSVVELCCRPELFFAQRGCWDGVVRRGRAVRVTVAAMQFIKSQKERPRRCVTISRSPVLISDDARGPFGGHSALPLTAREFWPTLGLPICDSQGGDAVLERGNRCLSPYNNREKGRIRRSWRLRGLVGKCPNLSMPLAKTHTSQSRPPTMRQGPPSAPNRRPASCSSLLAINFTGYP